MNKSKIVQEAKAAADWMKNGVKRGNSWARVCLLYKGSHATPNEKGIDRLLDALAIHFDGTSFGSTDIGEHYEIACSNAKVAKSANEYIAGWIAK